MEYCEDGDLYKKIREEETEDIPEDTVINWVSQILISLEYLHANKVIHRDLKTQNIFLSKDRLFLGDFGISKRLDNTQDLTNTYIGTPYYMSPELFNYQSYSFKSDLWSLGCVIFEICNKNHAFNAQTINGLAVKILKGDHNPLNPTYSTELRSLIESLLQVDQQARPSLEAIMRMDLFRPWIFRHFEQMMNIKSLTYDKLISLDDQIKRLLTNHVFEENLPQIEELFKKINNRKEILLKEKHLETLMSESVDRVKSEYSNNFEIEFDESLDSCLSQNLEDAFNDSGLSIKEEALKENADLLNIQKGNRVQDAPKKDFEKKKGTQEIVEETKEQLFDESFEKDLSFEEFKTKDRIKDSNVGQSPDHFVFEDLIRRRLDSKKAKLISLLGKDKFEEVLELYQDFDEADINFKTNVESK
jgi:serine/threonine protein kinase